MIEFQFTVTDSEGVHARPAGQLTKLAQKYQSHVTLCCKEKTADAKRILAVMALCAKCGDCLVIQIEGEDEQDAKTAIESYLAANL